jgi:two-component system nitrogen regulation sensor histidine kinase GlnL
MQALAHPVLVLDAHDRVAQANAAAEALFEMSAAQLDGLALAGLLPGSAVVELVSQCRAQGRSVAGWELQLATARGGRLVADLHTAVLPEARGMIVLTLSVRTARQRLDQGLSHRGAARSVVGLAEMLAHEVKNPLSGIRGAAQLLQASVDPGDRALTDLIVDEVDRICALVNRMDAFSVAAETRREPVNIHEVLERVRRLAQSGFARHVRFAERYDPSLPAVSGDRDQLIQVMLNLVKNAAEATPREGGEIHLATRFQYGARATRRDGGPAVALPILVSIQDNGAGIPEAVRPHLFEPFVTSKTNGSGLGLALVAKIVGDHGGLIEFDSQPRRTCFRLMLPIAEGGPLLHAS